MYSFRKKAVMPEAADILPGRTTALRVPEKHFVNGNRIVPPFPAGTQLTFWESHDPTQGMRQGNDIGTQYRSGIYVYGAEQKAAAEKSLAAYQERLTKAGYGKITTEILEAPEFYYAEDSHQQYSSIEQEFYNNPAAVRTSR